jgi:hypothetical protein
MPNRRLSKSELEIADEILEETRRLLATASGADPGLLFALRRKVYKELTYDERGKPLNRRKLKAEMRARQNGLCVICTTELPKRYAVLDRFVAAKGYVAENVQLICEPCDRHIQSQRKFT